MKGLLVSRLLGFSVSPLSFVNKIYLQKHQIKINKNKRKVNTAYDLAIRAEEAGLELFKEQSFVVEVLSICT